MNTLLIIGAGGLGRMTMEAVRDKYECYFIDDGYNSGEFICGVKILGGTKDLDILRNRYSRAVVAIGNNELREKLSLELIRLGYELPKIISNKAYVSPFAEIGEGTIVLPNACIQNGSKVGMCSVICSLVEIHHDSTVGNFSLVYSNSTVRTYARVGDRVKIGSNVSIGNKMTVNSNCEIKDGKVLINE